MNMQYCLPAIVPHPYSFVRVHAVSFCLSAGSHDSAPSNTATREKYHSVCNHCSIPNDYLLGSEAIRGEEL